MGPALCEPWSSGLSAPPALLRSVEEQSVFTGEATEKIGHCCQDMGEATEDLRGIRRAGPQSTRLQRRSIVERALKTCPDQPVVLTDGTFFLPCFYYISIQMSPDGAFRLCEPLISSECSSKTTLAQRPSNVSSQLSGLCCCCFSCFSMSCCSHEEEEEGA